MGLRTGLIIGATSFLLGRCVMRLLHRDVVQEDADGSLLPFSENRHTRHALDCRPSDPLAITRHLRLDRDRIYYYQDTMVDMPFVFQKLLHGVGTLSALLLISKALGGRESNWLFDGASLFLFGAADSSTTTRLSLAFRPCRQKRLHRAQRRRCEGCSVCPLERDCNLTHCSRSRPRRRHPVAERAILQRATRRARTHRRRRGSHPKKTTSTRAGRKAQTASAVGHLSILDERRLCQYFLTTAAPPRHLTQAALNILQY